MTDVEFLHSLTTLEPSFLKPMDSASPRRSRASYESAAASTTRSWVLLQNQNQANTSPPPPEPIPLPEPVPALDPATAATSPSPPAPRPLPEPPRRTNSNTENIDLPYPGLGLGHHWLMGHGAKAREAHPQKEKGGGSGFVGGFVSGLRRLPRALVRTRQRPRRGTMHTEEGTEGTDMTGNTLPQYVSNPNTPVVPGSTVVYSRAADAIREDENQINVDADAGRATARAQRLSFRVVPPATDTEEDNFIRQGPVVGDLPETHAEGASVLELPQTPLENPYDAPSMQRVPSAMATPRVSRADDRLTVPLPANEAASIQAHPQPTEDYRRMSAADAQAQARSSRHTTIDSPNNHLYNSTGGNSFTHSPSFSSELNGFTRFFNALHLLPWVATDRLTVDYRPRYKTQNLVSWYHPKGESAAIEREREVASVRAREIERGMVDTEGMSPPSRTRSPALRSDRSTHRTRPHRRRESIPEPPASAPPTTQGYGFPTATPYYHYPAFSPSPSPPPTHASRRRQSPRRQSSHRHHHYHHRRSASYPSQLQPHPNPQTPWIQSAASPLLPAPPAPVYVIQASPPPPSNASPPPTSSMQATPGGSPVPLDRLHSHLQGRGVPSPPLDPDPAKSPHLQGQMQMLTPVYMQMQLLPPPLQTTSSPAGSPQQVAFVPGYANGYGYGYGGVGVGGMQGYVPAYSSPPMGWQSPIVVPAPEQVVGG